jgi:predicted anti-sigma-YlaC factor YlaD
MIHCWLYQKVGFWFWEDSRPLPAQVQRHLESCPSCRQYFALHDTLINRLSAESSCAFQPEPPFLHEKIMAAIHAEKNARNTPVRTLPRWLLPAAGFALLALFVALTFEKSPQSSHNTTTTTTATAPAANQTAPTPVNTLASIDLPTNSVAQWSALLDDPLQTEMTSVIKDAKNAAQSLAANFLPPNYLE